LPVSLTIPASRFCCQSRRGLSEARSYQVR